MTDATLIQCTDSKRDEKAKAKNLYDKSGYFRDMRAYAKARGNPWFILSAKHGILHPDEEIEPYNERGISEKQAKGIAANIDSRGIDTVHITAGKDYTDPLVPELEARGIDVIEVARGMKIGERRSHLQLKVREMINGDLIQ